MDQWVGRVCARCRKVFTDSDTPKITEDGLYHPKCWSEGLQQLNAAIAIYKIYMEDFHPHT